MSATRHRRAPRRRLAAVALVLPLAACSGEPPAPEPSAAGTPLSSYDVADVRLERAPYCDRIAAPGVVEALNGSAADAEAWHSGESARLSDDLTDVAHEFGCRYTREGAAAETWLFAPPVTPEQADRLVREARRSGQCEAAPRGASFGQPSVALLCEGDDGRTASYRGLFGDSWLACSVTRPSDVRPEELVDVAGRWCVEVVEAARAG